MALPRLRIVIVALLFLPWAPAVNGLQESTVVHRERQVSLFIPAVGQKDDGSFFGVLSVLTLSAQSPGRGDVFVRTNPLAEVDMQGAARIAVRAAGELTGVSTNDWDYYFTITTTSPIIGGPSAGGAMAVVSAAILMNWSLDPNVAMTGMINPDLSIGLVGGVLYKAEAVAGGGAHTFLIPAGERIQYTTTTSTAADGTQTTQRQAVDIAQTARDRWGLKVIEVEDLYDTLPYFTGLRIEAPSTRVDPTSNAAYQTLMADVSGAQQANATAQHERAASEYEARKADIGRGDQDLVDQALSVSSAALVRASNASVSQRHYQASSFAFQSLVNSRYALALTGFYGQTKPLTTYLKAYVDDVATELERANKTTVATYPLTASQLGAQAAVEQRLLEADRLVGEARVAAATGQAATALRSASYAHERIGSALWWTILRDRVQAFGGPGNVTHDGLLVLADDYQSSAILMYSYAERVLSGATADVADRLRQAKAQLDQAGLALETDRVAAGVYGYLGVISGISGAMTGLNPPESLTARLGTVRARAAYDIEVARSRGVEPVFAVSQYEFAETLAASDPTGAYQGLTLARLASRVTLQASGFEASPIRAVALPFSGPAARALEGAAWAILSLLALPSALGLALALAVTTSALGRGKN